MGPRTAIVTNWWGGAPRAARHVGDDGEEERLLAALASGDRAAGERLRRAVLALPEDLRFTVTALYWGELPVREVARHEGVTTVAIRKRLKRALQALALALGEEPR